MARTRKSYGGRKSRKLKRRTRRTRRTRQTRRTKVKRGGSGGLKPWSASDNWAVEGVLVAPKDKGESNRPVPPSWVVPGGPSYNWVGGRSRVKRGGSGVTSNSIYSHATKPLSAYKSLPAAIPVSTTTKVLGGYFPFVQSGLAQQMERK
jgi:hypothetical protein